MAAEEVAAPGVDAAIHRGVLQLGHHLLHHGRGVDKTENPVGQGHGAEQRPLVGDLRVDRDVADALAGERKVLGIGGDDDAVLVGDKNAGHCIVAIDDFAVRLIGDQIDDGAVLFAGLAQQVAQRPAIPRPNRSGRWGYWGC